VPLLYSVCGTAQACAAINASEQALGLKQSQKQVRGRALLVQMETAKEHLWQILLDWPTLLERTPDSDGVAQMMALMKRFRLALFDGEDPFKLQLVSITETFTEVESCIQELETLLSLRLFNCSLVDWIGFTQTNELDHWIKRSPTSTGSMMDEISEPGWAELGAVAEEALPQLDDKFYHQQLSYKGGEAFIAMPTLEGRSRETSPFVREMNSPLVKSIRAKHGNGLLARCAARLLELASIPSRLRAGVQQLRDPDVVAMNYSSLPSGVGIAQVEAARGRLVHGIEIENRTVKRYRILAPTEWNFHPQGVLAKGLKQISATNDELLKHKATLLINAIDPCVGYDLNLQAADRPELSNA